MKRLFFNLLIIMIIVNITLNNCPTIAKNNNNIKIYNENIINDFEKVIIQDDNKFINNINNNKDEFGIWINTKFNGISDESKLDIDLLTFILMLEGGGWKYYTLSLEENNDSLAGLQFVRTKIYLEEEETFVNVIQTRFTFETASNTYEDFEASLDVRFPFSILKPKVKSYDFLNFLINKNYLIFLNSIKNNCNLYPKHNSIYDESEFHLRMGFSSPENNEGPNRVDTRFFFGRNSIFEPRVFRMKITPDNLDHKYNLLFFSSYLTTNEYGSETFYRTFSIDFEPAVELQITNIPKNGKISYDFGIGSGSSTKISFNAIGGSLSNIMQSFIIDPLPDYMSFDLTILGERSFTYQSDRKYSVKYIMESIDEGNLVSLELDEIPEIINAEWGLNLFLLSLSGNGFVDLNMSDDLGRMALSLVNTEKPFIEIDNFPRKLRVDGFIDVPSLKASITATKYIGQTTSINIPLIFDKWEIIGTINIYNGYGHASFDLPDNDSDYVSLGLDTNNNPLLGFGLIVNDLELDKRVLYVSVDAIATDDFYLSFDYISSQICNFKWSGKITDLIDLIITIDYHNIGFNLESSWNLGTQGLFVLKMNKEILFNLNQIEFGDIKLDGFINVYPGTKLEIEWERGDNGYIKFESDGIEFSPKIELNFIDKNSNEIFILCNIILNNNCILKFDWEWDEIGYFTIFTNDLIENLKFEVGYNFDDILNEFEYGFRINGSDINLIRTIKWDTENGVIPRIWILGDNTLPGNWDIWLLWKYEWYEVK